MKEFKIEKNIENLNSSYIKRLQEILRRFGYLNLEKGNEGIFDSKTSDSLKKFQEWNRIPITGTLDIETVNLLNTPRCGNADITKGINNIWNKSILTYSFIELTNDINEGEIRLGIRDAFDLWQEVTNFQFEESLNNHNADIIIRFVTGNHGDGNTFDGPNGILAHAFYPPPNGGNLAGDIHFDDSELWTIQIPTPFNRFDLITVATHEIGHSLGLDHSSNPNAIMKPFYSGIQRHLDIDDIIRIQSLYGFGWNPIYQQIDPGNGIGGFDLKSRFDKAFAFDYNGTGKLDHIALYRPGKGAFFIIKNDNGIFSPVYQQIDPGNGIGGFDLKSRHDKAFAFDYNGTGKLDHIVLYRPGKGAFFIIKNDNGIFSPVYQQIDPGNGIGGYDLKSTADRAFAFDYNGTGKLDHIVLYRPGKGGIFILKNDNGNFYPVYKQHDPGNGIGGFDLKSIADRAFAFDYNGTGKLDHIVLYRPGTGAFFIIKNDSGNFYPVYEQIAPGNGIGGFDLKSPYDKAFAFDYDKSGKLDHIVLYRSGKGTFWVLHIQNGVITPKYFHGDPGNGIGGFDLKSKADRAFAFDYNGTGKNDHVVLYRPGKGACFIIEKE
ncbi:matrixin family metalloprotease [uncultured Algibacter sp.]|uniref:matrixin family metalloprotease n=1 Tax=uncultured Algibacter sp. TaxID=298659 RepID=UPI002632D707|nr:matrixin family metalloprotease [uncultured Algibacter sp.]